MRIQEGAPTAGQQLRKVPVPGDQNQHRAVQQIQRHHPFDEAEAVSGDFGCGVDADNGSHCVDADLPRNRPPVSGVCVPMRQKLKQRPADESEYCREQRVGGEDGA